MICNYPSPIVWMFILQQIHNLLMGILKGNENCHNARSVAYWTIPSGNLSWFGNLHLRTLFYTVLYKYGRLLNKQTLHYNGWWFQYICCTHRRLKMPCPDSYRIMSIDVTHFDQRNRCWNAWTCIANDKNPRKIPSKMRSRHRAEEAGTTLSQRLDGTTISPKHLGMFTQTVLAYFRMKQTLNFTTCVDLKNQLKLNPNADFTNYHPNPNPWFKFL